MKKHLLGAAIFSFIFLSFSLAFAFFYPPPVTQFPEVRIEIDGRMETVGKGKTSCFGKREKDITYEIQ